MATMSEALTEEANTLLEQLTKEQRDILLSRLVTEKLDEESALASIPIYRPDGSLLGHIRRLTPPSADEQAEMSDRARRVDPRAGKSSRDLLDLMKAGGRRARQEVHSLIATP
ncbi:MAG: hypothetical protein ACHRXM_31890 [Isosphaerales bacterium]